MVRYSSQVCVKGHWLHEGCYHSVGTLFFWTLAFYSILSILPQLSMPPYRAGKASAIEKKIQSWPQWPRIKFPCFYFCNRRNAKRYEKKDNKAEESGKPGKNVNTGTEKKRAQEPDTTESAPPPRKSRKQKNWSKESHVDVYFGAAVGNLCKKITGYTTCSLIWKWFLLANQFAMWPVLLWQNIYRCLDTDLQYSILKCSCSACWKPAKLGAEDVKKNVSLPIHAVCGFDAGACSFTQTLFHMSAHSTEPGAGKALQTFAKDIGEGVATLAW